MSSIRSMLFVINTISYITFVTAGGGVKDGTASGSSTRRYFQPAISID